MACHISLYVKDKFCYEDYSSYEKKKKVKSIVCKYIFCLLRIFLNFLASFKKFLFAHVYCLHICFFDIYVYVVIKCFIVVLSMGFYNNLKCFFIICVCVNMCYIIVLKMCLNMYIRYIFNHIYIYKHISCVYSWYICLYNVVSVFSKCCDLVNV